jgi:hypothetical protein
MLKLILIMLVIWPVVIAVLSSAALGSKKWSAWVRIRRARLTMIPIIFAVSVALFLLASIIPG